MKALIIDNYDSFTWNLFQYLAEINSQVPIVVKNDQLDLEKIRQLEFNGIIISPGPGRPEVAKDFGICKQIILELSCPILGVCLGHQGIAHAYGGNIISDTNPIHGIVSKIYHNGNPLFSEIPPTFHAVRYHSLLVENNFEYLIDLEKIAWTDDNLVMGLAHKKKNIWGIQFHPESICSEYGITILKNFSKLADSLKSAPKFYARTQKNANSFWGNNSFSKNHLTYNAENYTLSFKKLNFMLDSKQVFIKLFSNDEQAVWLDSNEKSFTTSDCNSLDNSGFTDFSFMSGSSIGGPLFYKLTYNTNNKKVTIHQFKEDKSVEKTVSSLFDFLKEELSKFKLTLPSESILPFNFHGGLIGYFGYEMKNECGYSSPYHSPYPDANFLFVDRFIAFDHRRKNLYLVCLEKLDNNPAELNASPVSSNSVEWFNFMTSKLQALKDLTELTELNRPNENSETNKPAEINLTNSPFNLKREYHTYIDDIHKCLEHIYNGESYEICLTNQFQAPSININPLDYYLQLREINPAPYASFLRFNDLVIASSSPERFMLITPQKIVESKPMKGTIRRGKTPEEDLKLKEFLKNDLKTKVENLMICDLVRNVLGTVSEIGSIQVPQLMEIESYATVHQMISTIRGKLQPHLQALDCIQAAFPGGSMTGAPQKRTMEIIDQLEKSPRGIYSGAIGYLSLSGGANFSIVIRTAVFYQDKISIGVGGAIVSLSDPEKEFEEILLKGQALQQAVSSLCLATSY